MNEFADTKERKACMCIPLGTFTET